MKIWTYVFAGFLLLLTLACSQRIEHSNRSVGLDVGATGRRTDGWGRVKEDKDKESPALRRLESVTWDSVKHELKWEISTGRKKADGYQPRSSNRYEIKMDKAIMTFNGSSRRFSQDEALRVRMLMDFVSKYAVESTVWWENGEGEPIDDKDIPGRPERPKPEKEPGGGGKSKTVGIVAMQVIAE